MLFYQYDKAFDKTSNLQTNWFLDWTMEIIRGASEMAKHTDTEIKAFKENK